MSIDANSLADQRMIRETLRKHGECTCCSERRRLEWFQQIRERDRRETYGY